MKQKQFASYLAVAVAVAAIGGTSTFGESRPQNATSGTNITVRGERPSSSSTARKSDESSNRGSIDRRDRRTANRHERVEPRSGSRVERQRPSDSRVDRRDRAERGERSDGRIERERRGYEHDRERMATQGRRGGRDDRRDARYSDRQYGQRQQPHYAHGRVSKVRPYHSGYHVWIAGDPYPFYVPRDYYRRHGLRVGISIRLGGYYNRGGYYDFYDDDYYYDRDRYYDRGSYGRGDIRGYVEDVDYRRGTFVIRNERTGTFVTVVDRDRSVRVREGDYVEISGEWRRGGVFRAYDIDILDRYRRR